jgi:hypothetical protein
MSAVVRVVTCMAILICAVNLSRAQVKRETKEYKYLSTEGRAIAAQNKEAPEEYQKALDAIKAGNEAKAKGDDATAYCQYGEAIYKLNLIAEKYPDWNKDTVAKQLKNITDVSDKLTAVTCKNLEQMKDAQFRLEVWERQVLMLKKLDRIMERLDYLEKEYWNKDDEYIKDIRAVLFKQIER